MDNPIRHCRKSSISMELVGVTITMDYTNLNTLQINNFITFFN